MKDLITYSTPIVAILTAAVGIFFGSWLSILKGTNKLLREQNGVLQSLNKDLADKFATSLQELSCLEGQVQVLKLLPLKHIDASLKALSASNRALVTINSAILKVLGASAATLKTDTEHAVAAAESVRKTLADHDGGDRSG